jgi:hypothetical protein
VCGLAKVMDSSGIQEVKAVLTLIRLRGSLSFSFSFFYRHTVESFRDYMIHNEIITLMGH